MALLNPGNDRTFTVSEVQAFDIIDSLNDRIEALEYNIAATDLHTLEEVAGFTETVKGLRAIVAIIEGAD